MKKGFGARQSQYDQRTVIYKTTAVAPLLKGGVIYSNGDHLNQWYEGICTAIWLVQNRKKRNSKNYSYDFQYLLQKKFVDKDWYEGSSIFSALKVGKNYGFLPAELWTHTTEADLKLPYSEYIAKLQTISDTEINRLLALCIDKILGYAQVDLSSSQTVAKAILDSRVGIGCRFECGNEWYNPSTPLLPPGDDIIGAHAIGMTYFDYSKFLDQKLANTWGEDWNGDGNADVYFDKYKPTEAWIILETVPLISQPTIKNGATGTGVKLLQTELNEKMNAGLLVDGSFGAKTKQAVISFQTKYNLGADGIVGQKTWQAFNTIDIITSVCNKYGIKPEVCIAVATWEGGLWNPKATLFNPGSNSTDRGIFQWNDFYHKEISDADAFNITKATEWTCKYLKENKANLHGFWSASQHNWIKMLSSDIIKEYKLL